MNFKIGDACTSSLEFFRSFKLNKETIFSAFNQPTLLRWLDNVKFETSKYDKAMDSNYLASHIGGHNHRLFDGGHTLFQAWEKAQSARQDDTFLQEVMGFMKSLWNDGSTVKGLPFKTLEKANYDKWVDSISNTFPGISKEWLYDMLSFDALELTSSVVGVVAAIFLIRGDDLEKFDQLLGSMSVSSAMGANPIMGIITICLAGYAYFYKKNEMNGKALGKSAALTAVSGAVFMILGWPFLVELVIVLVAAHLLKKKVLNNDAFLEMVSFHLKSRAKLAKGSLKNHIESLIGRMKRAA